MSDSGRSQATTDVDAGVDYVLTDRDQPAAGVRDQLQQVMSRVQPDDLSTTEVTALLNILKPADCRLVGGPAGGPALHLVRAAGD